MFSLCDLTFFFISFYNICCHLILDTTVMESKFAINLSVAKKNIKQMSSYYTVKFRGFTSKYPTMQVIADKLSRSFISGGTDLFSEDQDWPFYNARIWHFCIKLHVYWDHLILIGIWDEIPLPTPPPLPS